MIIEGQWAVAEFDTAKIDYGVAMLPAGSSGKSATNIGIGVASVFDHGSAAQRGRHHVRQVAGPARARAPTSPRSAAACRAPRTSCSSRW